MNLYKVYGKQNNPTMSYVFTNISYPSTSYDKKYYTYLIIKHISNTNLKLTTSWARECSIINWIRDNKHEVNPSLFD